MKIKNLGDLEQVKNEGLRLIYPDKLKITVGMATCGIATGAQEVYDEMKIGIEKEKLDAILTKTGCLGFCQKEPLVDLFIPGLPKLTYEEMTPDKVKELVNLLKLGQLKEEYLLCKFEEEFLLDELVKKYDTSKSNGNLDGIPSYYEVPFFAKQKKIVLRNCGFINPDSIEEYIAKGGYSALYNILTQSSPEQVIEELKKSGLRGRGGAGFPTGRKWEFCRKAKGNIKYIVCNADEGDPGAYMDRSVLEGDPHSVLEGMLIGACSIGAFKGFIYVRSEYPLAIVRLKQAIKQLKGYGLLGENIFNSGFNFDIEIREGSGAFVCGEETSLMHSIEGVSPEPSQRPPFPAQSGLWGYPTNINNVETWANIPAIILKGGDWYSETGTEKSKGTKVFSLVGKVKNTGLVEVPMGITLREIIYDIGGGILKDKSFKAAQTGGPSGGCIPANLIDLPVDYERLAEVGSIMGSGGMVVMDEDTCMVDVAKYFLTFTNDESCGKCTSCREGSEVLLEILTKISNGEGENGDIEFLQELGEAIKDASMCGLGQTLPNPVLSILQHFKEEYEDHIKYKRCPSTVCGKIIFTPCKYSCPVKTDVPAFIAHIARKEYRQAFEVIRAPNPLSITCGFICHHPCEDRCRLLDIGSEAMSIKALKRFAGEYVFKNGFKALPKPEVPMLEKVAIVGSGPAGLAAAFDLTILGYQVIVFEASSVAGGNLALVIPEYRLPRQIVDREIEQIKQVGVTILTNTPVGPDLTFDDIFSQGYKAILLATGAHRSIKLGQPGEDATGVMDSFGFLESVKIGKEVTLGEKVGVVGGGNAAIDAARTALRIGATEVSIIYRRSKAEMPAIKREIKVGVEEGVKIMELAAPARIIFQNGQLTGVECVAMELGDYDDTGRRRPVPIPDSEFILSLDNLILAIGEEPDLSFLPSGHGLKINKQNTIVTDPETLVTEQSAVFAAGDVVTGPSTIADSIASGKLAAVSIDKFLRGQPIVREYSITTPSPYVEPVKPTEEEVELQRSTMPCAPIAERVRNFGVVELGLSEDSAIKEAKRCLRCDLK